MLHPEAREAAETLDALRRIGGEPESVEVKSGAGGFPRSVQASLVAFANGDGGTVIIGVDEGGNFAVVPGIPAAQYRDDLVALARGTITPPLQIETDVVALDAGVVLLARVPAARPDHKPVYITAKGVSNGAYLRTGDGDRRMSEGEIGLLYAGRSQPTYDRESIDGSSRADLDWPSLRRTLERVQGSSAKLRDVPEATALFRIGVFAEPRDDSPLTMAGLLSFGAYPQQFFPQLMVSVVVYPGDAADRVRFLDNATVRGPIPDMVAETLRMLRRNLAARAVMTDFGRTDRLDYPLEAIREAIVNAVLHRDYSPLTRGTQIQVELYPDRLTVRSPGGLYGDLVPEALGENERASTSRNALLASLLSDTYLPGSEDLVAENRSTGIPTMIRLARESGLPRPAFTSDIRAFTVTMSRSQLLGREVREWIAELGVPVPTSVHEIALAMLRDGPVTNSMLREWGADLTTASQALRYLVDQGIAIREGSRRYARYVLDPRYADRPRQPMLALTAVGDTSRGAAATADHLRRLGSASARELEQATGRTRPTVVGHLNTLVAQGLARAVGASRSPKRRYEWIGPRGRDEGQR